MQFGKVANQHVYSKKKGRVSEKKECNEMLKTTGL
jgi:hypothetical protein